MSVAHLRIVIEDPRDAEDVVTRAGTPNEQVAALYERHKHFVFRVALRYARGDRGWAEDVTQEVFMRLFDGPERLHALENPRAWFYRVATNRCLTRLRSEARRRRLRGLFGITSQIAPSPEQGHLESESLRRALAFVDGLDPDMRGCFYMHHVDALPQKEIAEVLGTTPSRVCRMLQRIERQLRALDAEEGSRA